MKLDKLFFSPKLNLEGVIGLCVMEEVSSVIKAVHVHTDMYEERAWCFSYIISCPHQQLT